MDITILCHQQPISTKSYNAAAGSLRRLQAAAAGRQILSYTVYIHLRKDPEPLLKDGMLRLWKVEEFFLQAVSILTDRKIGHQEYVSFYFLAAINSFLTGRQISFIHTIHLDLEDPLASIGLGFLRVHEPAVRLIQRQDSSRPGVYSLMSRIWREKRLDYCKSSTSTNRYNPRYTMRRIDRRLVAPRQEEVSV